MRTLNRLYAYISWHIETSRRVRRYVRREW